MDKYKVLKHYFGYTEFRGGQEQLIDSVLNGRDVLGIMPTGGGKSLCYQIPALMMRGITIVISPLISLMKDQVAALKNAGVSAAYINSSLTNRQVAKVYENLKQGTYKVLYIAPERLLSDGFEELARQLPISMVAVDEAHCVSQWGNDFRPSYLKIAEFMRKLDKRPILTAFTATATDNVRQDIETKLEMYDPVRVVTGFDRPNLKFSVLQPKSKSDAVLKLLRERVNRSGIIYCSTRNNVEKICQLLIENGFPATRYHAGLEDAERHTNQEDFVYDIKPIMVATNAFGMGIDKSNVSYVIHYNMPLSLEAYYQEAGRAGRDGESAECILLYSPADIRTASMLIEMSGENVTNEEREELLRRDYARLNIMTEYCKTTKCFRGYILDYFGQSHGEKCGNCGNCQTQFKEKDITVEAQKILSCIKRIYGSLGYYVGTGIVSKVLCGSDEKKIIDLGLKEITTYGIMKGTPRSEVVSMISHLTDLGYIYKDDKYDTLRLSDTAKNVLHNGERVAMKYKEEPPKKLPNSKKATVAVQNDDLYELLRQTRFAIANEEKVPAYIIFSNATLMDMSAKMPVTIEEFLEVSGVGKVKAEMYGDTFLFVIKEYVKGKL